MPRIKKRGLDYFPLNTDFIYNRLVRRIMKREGDAALSVLIEVLSYIYSGEGYYVRADNLFYEDLSSNLYEKSSEDVKRIVALAVEYGVFDTGLFSRYGILTSAEIQQQYCFSTKRRKNLCLEPDFMRKYRRKAAFRGGERKCGRSRKCHIYPRKCDIWYT